jgi:hypothetical protein
MCGKAKEINISFVSTWLFFSLHLLMSRLNVPEVSRGKYVRLLGLWVRIPPGRGCLSFMNVGYYQVEVSALGL